MMREWEEGHLFHFRLFIRGTDKTKKDQKEALPLEVFLSSIKIIHSTDREGCLFNAMFQEVLPEGDVASDVVMEPVSACSSSNLMVTSSTLMTTSSELMVATSTLVESDNSSSNQLDLSGNHSSEEEVTPSSKPIIASSVNYAVALMVGPMRSN